MQAAKVQTEVAQAKPDMKAAAAKAWITRRANLATKQETAKTEAKAEQPAKAEKKPSKERKPREKKALAE